MESNFVHIEQLDGSKTRLYCYGTTDTTILGNVLILHGMTEHHERYLPFIQVLNKTGFDVYIYDHRGHGTDKKFSDLGFFAKKGGADLVVNDAHIICNYIKACGRSDKLAVFGHSMGSLILRCLIQQYHDIDCAVPSSTAVPSTVACNFGIFLANLLCMFQGPKKKSKFLEKNMFGTKAYTSLCTRTSFDWLTRNNTEVGKYVYDPFCGFTCTTSFYRDLLLLIKRANQSSGIKKAKKQLPLLFLTGDKDPVGGYAKSVTRLYKRYKRLGFTNADLKVYKEARHELLHELNCDEVIEDIITFLKTALGCPISSNSPKTKPTDSLVEEPTENEAAATAETQD